MKSRSRKPKKMTELDRQLRAARNMANIWA